MFNKSAEMQFSEKHLKHHSSYNRAEKGRGRLCIKQGMISVFQEMQL